MLTPGSEKTVVVIGAGPAGLTAGYELTKYHLQPIVVESLGKVGGIARTESYKGFSFDMGGHRFFTKSKVVNRFWQEFLGPDFLLRPRLSRIYYQDKFFNYPLRIMNALWGLGIWQSIGVGLSYVKWQLFPYRVENTFEEWVTNRFGKRLFEIFFKTYTEKVWGVSTSDLKAEFAMQRIKDLSLKTALINRFIKPKENIKTLIEEFHYPRLGPGMLWEQVRQGIEKGGGHVYLHSPVSKIYHSGDHITAVEISHGMEKEIISGTDFISSMPLSEFINKLDSVPSDVLQAANQLQYRDFLTVCLIINKDFLFPDNWIYVHSPGVKVCRIQNFKNWSPDMVPDPAKSGLGMEYFCCEGDELWSMPDADLVELGRREIDRIGLARYEDVEDGVVYRVPKAYPIYNSEYRNYLTTVRKYIDGFVNFQTIGRNGLHRYNNQDHSMVTGMKAVRNIVFGEKNDLWNINDDRLYQEEISSEELASQDLVEVFTRSLTRVFLRMDKFAFGISLGIITGLTLFFATLFLVVKGGDVVGPTLNLLNNFLPGYRVDLLGSLIGLVYGLILGFISGWCIAYLRNLLVYLGAMILDRDIRSYAMKDLLDELLA